MTNGAIFIPKLILVDDNNRVFGIWGSRSQLAAQLVLDHKEKHGELWPEIKEEIQHGCTKDRVSSTLQEVVALLPVQ